MVSWFDTESKLYFWTIDWQTKIKKYQVYKSRSFCLYINTYNNSFGLVGLDLLFADIICQKGSKSNELKMVDRSRQNGCRYLKWPPG